MVIFGYFIFHFRESTFTKMESFWLKSTNGFEQKPHCCPIQWGFYLLNYFPNILPTICTILVEFLFAIPFPIAFPPTVSDATIALIINCKSKFNPNFSVIFIVIRAAIEPLRTPTNISYYICTNI